MAKLAMKQICIYGLKEDRKRFLETLQALGAVEVTPGEMPAEGFSREDHETEAQALDRSASLAEQALAIVNEAAPEKKGLLASFSGRREITADERAEAAEHAEAWLEACERVLALSKEKAEHVAEGVRIRAAVAQLEPWRTLDVPFGFSGTRETAAFIGAFPQQYTQESLAQALAEQEPELLFDFELVNASFAQTCAVILVPAAQRELAENALRTLGFSRPGGAADTLPAEKLQELRAQEEARVAALASLQEQIVAYAEQRHDFELLVDYLSARAEKHRVVSVLDQSRHTFALRGYVTAEDSDRVCQTLEALGPVAIELTDADPEQAPVKLKNNAFAKPAEGIVMMYAAPGVGDIDPTPITAFFYYFFFGMMFSDAAYGLLMAVACAIVLKKVKLEEKMRNNVRLFRNCGISTFLWGLVFGSFFGDAPAALYTHYTGITPVFHTLTGAESNMPCLFNPIEDAIVLLVISIALGLLQVLAGLGCKFYILWKQGNKLDAVFDVGFWMLLLVGLAVLAGGMVWAPLMTVGAVISVACAVGLVLTQGRNKKGPMKVLGGLASLYDITGYISDLMSYSRLLALGLTTGVMGMVFNTLSTMFGTSALSIIPMLLIFVLGHAINFGLNVLGSYVHTMRLQYVEMFAKFYEGGGRAFAPFAFHSKYTKVQEEKQV